MKRKKGHKRQHTGLHIVVTMFTEFLLIFSQNLGMNPFDIMNEAGPLRIILLNMQMLAHVDEFIRDIERKDWVGSTTLLSRGP